MSRRDLDGPQQRCHGAIAAGKLAGRCSMDQIKALQPARASYNFGASASYFGAMGSFAPDWENIASFDFDELVAEAGVQPAANDAQHDARQRYRRSHVPWLRFLRTEEEELTADAGPATPQPQPLQPNPQQPANQHQQHHQRQPPHPSTRARRQAPKIFPFSRLEGPGGFGGLPAPPWYTRPPGAVGQPPACKRGRDTVPGGAGAGAQQQTGALPTGPERAGGSFLWDVQMLEVAGSPVGVAGGEWRAGKEQLAASAATWQSPDALPRLSQEPPPEGAPYTELLHSLQRIGSDLCRMAAAGGLPGDDWGEWLEEWHALLRQALEQLKRLLVDRAAVSNYPAQGSPGDAGMQGCSPSGNQQVTNHTQLKAAVELLLLQVAELPSPQGAGVAGAALDAVDYLVCKSSFADFDRWQEVLSLSLQRLAGWLQQQSQLVAEMSEVADLTMEVRRLRLLGPCQLGGLQWCDATTSNPTSSGYRDMMFSRLAAEQRHVLGKLCKQLTVLVRAVGRSLAEVLLQPAAVQALLQPDRTRDACRNDKLLLLSTAVQVLALQQHCQQPLPQSGGNGTVAAAVPFGVTTADSPTAAAVGHGGARGAYELVVGSQLQVAVERLLYYDYNAPVDLSVHAITPQAPCRDYAVPLLGFLHALTQHANNQPSTSHVQKATLGSWDRIEAAAAAAVGFVGGGSSAFLRRVWESRLEPHQRMLAVALLASAARGLVALRRTDLVAGALLPARAGPTKEQLGLLGVWLRLAMEGGSDRAMLQLLTAELLRAPEARALFCCFSASSAIAIASPEAAAADICGRSEAVAEQVLAALSALAQQRQQLPALEAQQRSSQLLALLDGLDTSVHHLNEELRRGDAAASPATGDGAGKDPTPLSAATLQAHRHMTSVAMAAQAACAGGSLDLHAALGGVLLGGGTGRPDAARWERAQGAVRLLEAAAAMVVEDVASLTFHAGCDAAAVLRWHEALRRRSSGGLMAELWSVLTHVFDSRADLTPLQGKSSVQTRQGGCVLGTCLLTSIWCLVLLCSVVTELPGAEGTPEHAKAAKLRLLAARAAAQQLAPLDAADAAPAISAARDSAARALHRCVTGAVRHYCKAGLGAHLKTALVRYGTNALGWLRELLRQPELRQTDVAERLMPALLCLVAEALCEVRGQLLAQQLLVVDGEVGTAATQPTQPQSAGDALSRRRLSLRLVGAVLEAAADVMKLAAENGLLASQEQAGKTEKGSVHIESSPLQCMEAAPRGPLRAAVGCTLGLLLRVCVECSVVWLRPDGASAQSAVLTAAFPPQAEHRREVLSRLSSCAGFPAPAEEWQAVRNELRACSSPHVSKLAGRPPHQEGADEAVRLSTTALGCLARLAEECGTEGSEEYKAMLQAAVAFADLPAWYDNMRQQEQGQEQEQSGSAALDVPPLLARVSACSAISKLSQHFCVVATLMDGSLSGPPRVLLYVLGEEAIAREMHRVLSRQPIVAVYGAQQFKGAPPQSGQPFKVKLEIDTRANRSDMQRCGVVVRPRSARVDQVREAVNKMNAQQRASQGGAAPSGGNNGLASQQPVPAPDQTQQGPLATAPMPGAAGGLTAPATLPRGGLTPLQAAGPEPQAGTTPAVDFQARGPPEPEGVPPPQRHVTPWRGVFAAASDDEDDPLDGGRTQPPAVMGLWATVLCCY
eukprot:XP_001690348.1 predicted protein [Chlamydomonas reinhardtii]